MKKIIVFVLALSMGLMLVACSNTTNEQVTSETESSSAQTELEKIDNSKWQYNSDDDVYYQLGISYCAKPADSDYENLAIIVPGKYMTGTENGDGTYTCEINENETVGNYTAETAPFVMPVNTPGYSAMEAMSSYQSVKDYTDAGFIYVHAGCRGRDSGAPTGVTDLKAAVRYIRYIADEIPGNTENFFTFGMSGGGAQSALMGVTGNSELYDSYLEAIGAVMDESDAVLGSMCWCPITNLDTADEAYEWMMGATRSGLSDEELEISNSLAEEFATYINSAGIKDADGNVLELSESSDGIYQAGSYYDYIKSVIEGSLENFIEDTEFPYDASSSNSGGMMNGGGPGGAPSDLPDGEAPSDLGDGQKPSDLADGETPSDLGSGDKPEELDSSDASSDASSGEMPTIGDGPSSDSEFPDGETVADSDNQSVDESETSIEDVDNIQRNETSGGLSFSGTYETVSDYIDALNADGEWVTYDESTGEVTIASVEDFVKALKIASKGLGAFDQLDRGQGENTLFGWGDSTSGHFDSILAEITKTLGSEYSSDFEEDFEKTDSVGNTVDVRLNMYSPMYYLLESQEGYGTSDVAKYFRIRTGITQSDCALTTEVNLKLALQNYDGVESVDFETIWGAGHEEAERTGDSTSNFIDWVNDCLK